MNTFTQVASADDVTAICRALIAAPSENPPGGETLVAQLAADLLSEAGYRIEWHEAVPGRPNVVARIERGRGRSLILQAHSDTKPAAAPGTVNAWSTDPLLAQERDGQLYGLGACDAKGGLAAMLVAARSLARIPGWSGELVLEAVADEEDGSAAGAEVLLGLGLLAADGAIVAEPTECRPSLAQLGNAWAEILITGKAAHAGTPARGRDAFRAAAGFVSAVESLLAGIESAGDFPGHPHLNVGELSMPGHPGTVPGECRLRCDIRVLPGRDRDRVFALYRIAAKRVAIETGCEMRVTPYQGGGCQSHRVNPQSHLVRTFLRVPGPDGRLAEPMPFPGGTDARYFAMAGTPAVVYGPGSLERAHAPDERVPVLELAFAAEHLQRICLAFFQD